jgi:hypothetical protein
MSLRRAKREGLRAKKDLRKLVDEFFLRASKINYSVIKKNVINNCLKVEGISDIEITKEAKERYKTLINQIYDNLDHEWNRQAHFKNMNPKHKTRQIMGKFEDSIHDWKKVYKTKCKITTKLRYFEILNTLGLRKFYWVILPLKLAYYLSWNRIKTNIKNKYDGRINN